jgi:hypothetical protein
LGERKKKSDKVHPGYRQVKSSTDKIGVKQVELGAKFPEENVGVKIGNHVLHKLLSERSYEGLENTRVNSG